MQKLYVCSSCQQAFEAQGTKSTRVDPILGQVWQWQAPCPRCNVLAKEQKTRLSSSGQTDYGAQPPSCATGTCPFIN